MGDCDVPTCWLLIAGAALLLGTLFFRLAQKHRSRRLSTESNATNVVVGNTTGNYANGGAMVKYGDVLFFRHDGDLWRMRIDGTDCVRAAGLMGRGYCTGCLSIVDRWLYYAVRDDDRTSIGKAGVQILKVKLHSELKERTRTFYLPKVIFSSPKEMNFSGLVPLGTSLVYCSGNVDRHGLFEIQMDGPSHQRSRSLSTNFDCRNLQVHRGSLYYRNGQWDQSSWDRIGATGVGEQVLPKTQVVRRSGGRKADSEGRRYESVNVVDPWLYYVTFLDSLGHSAIFRARVDGTEEMMLSQLDATMLNVADGWIYFAKRSDGRRLHKIRVDGSRETRLAETQYVTSVYVFGEVVFCYFSQHDDFAGRGLFAVNLDGTNHRVIKEWHPQFRFDWV